MPTVNLSRLLSSAIALAAAGLLIGASPIACSSTPPPDDAHQLPTATASQTAAPTAAPSASASATASSTADVAPPAPKAHRYAVAAENATAVRVAMEVLAKGGSAADGAIAALLGVGVAQPVSSGIGGGGFAVVYDAKTKKITILDFRETAPAGIKAADYTKRPPPDDKRGVMTGVPGEIAGLYAIHERWGKLAFADDVRGAADAAEKGFPLSAHLARTLKWNEAWVKKTPRFGFYLANDALRPAGDTIVNTALAGTLRKIAAEGKAAFYEGTIAKDILDTAHAGGSKMTADELKSFKVTEREPLHTTWEGYDVYTMPPPSGGGLMMLETLAMHSKADLAALGWGTGAYYHVLAETFKGAVADRVRAVGDPAFTKIDIAKLTDPARMKARRARIKMDSALPAEKFPLQESGTSHVVVADAEGNVVSVTSTVNNMFGSKLVTAGGFVLNDELDDFTPENVDKLFGVKKGPNAPRGGAKPASSMTPTIVLKGDKPVLALGGSGGYRIATGCSQVLLSVLGFGRSVSQAVADPRIETPPMGGLLVDASLPADVIEDLKKRGQVVDSSKPNFSAVQAMSFSEKDGVRTIEAAADPRKGGEGKVE
jgi:gamma-glutamyltranspeptidase/glutathione hydrolase